MVLPSTPGMRPFRRLASTSGVELECCRNDREEFVWIWRLLSAFKETLDQPGVKVPLPKLRSAKERLKEGDRSFYPDDSVFPQRSEHSRRRLSPILTEGDQFGDERVVVHGDFGAQTHTAVVSNTWPPWLQETQNRSWRGEEIIH